METEFENLHDQSASNQVEVAVIMVPFLEQSHLNQLLYLSCLLSSYNIDIHYACSIIPIHQAKLRFNDKAKLESSKIHFHELPIPPFTSTPPDPNSVTRFPSHLQSLFDSSLSLRHPTADLFHTISASYRRVVVIHDMCMCYTVQDAINLPNFELYAFNPISAFSSVFGGTHMREGPSFIEEPKGLPSNDGGLPLEVQNFLSLQVEFLKARKGTIFNSCRPMEGTYLDLLEKEEVRENKKLWAVGPLHLGTNVAKSSLISKHKCIEWLDKQAPNSVLYISFGTTTSMKDEEIKEIAMGLEQSGQKFIWVLRKADKGNIFEGDVEKTDLPYGYEERVKDYGVVVRDWAPQVEILGHSSTGGFMSHCGWNSCLESISMGVPIIGWPMHSDQPVNAFLLANVLKVGLDLHECKDDNELVTSSAIAKAAKTLIASEKGEAIRKTSKELGRAIRDGVKEGGVSNIEFKSFVSHITRLDYN